MKGTKDEMNDGRIEDQDILGVYLREIHEIPLLSHEEEDEIALRAARGDREAMENLVKANLRFVIKVAKRYRNQGLPFLDLISEGNVGLIKAAEHYEQERGVHFVTYAVWWIRQSIIKALNEKGRAIRIPANKIIEAMRLHDELPTTDGHITGRIVDEAARRMHRRPEYIRHLMLVERNPLSLDHPLSLSGKTPRENEIPLGTSVADENAVEPIEETYNESLRKALGRVLDTLDEREAAVLRCRFGLENGSPMTLDEVGYLLKLSKERVRQIETKAIKSLQHPKRKHELLKYVA